MIYKRYIFLHLPFSYIVLLMHNRSLYYSYSHTLHLISATPVIIVSIGIKLQLSLVRSEIIAAF